jgi:hypothetical protein
MPGEPWSFDGGRPNPSQRIFVVEDEPDLRRLNTEMLQKFRPGGEDREAILPAGKLIET